MIIIPNVNKENSCLDCPVWSLCWDNKPTEDICKDRCPIVEFEGIKLFDDMPNIETESKRDFEVVVNEACLNCELDCVEVVRCHDCRNYEEAKNGCNGFCKEWNTSVYTWDYCSKGEKKMRTIDADALIPLIQEDKIEGKTLDIIKVLGDGLQAETLNQACDRHIKIINSLPTIEAEPKHGRWIPVTNGRGGFECSVCTNYAPSYRDGVEWHSRFCPTCGARMDLDEVNNG